jgi:parvulin-like peptidyl-prolyl isomerase
MTTFLSNRRLLVVAACSATLAALAAGCGGSSSSSSLPDGVAAIVDGQQIPVSAVTQLVAQARASAQAQKTAFPKEGSDQYKQVIQQGVGFLVQKAELQQQAKKEHVTVTDKQVSDRLDQLVKQNFGGSQKRYRAELKKRSVTDAQVRDDIRLQLLQAALVAKITKAVKVDDGEVRTYYIEHAPSYSKPQSRQVEHILVKTKSLADKIYAQLKGGADFATLAKKYTIDTSTKPQGGKLTVCRGEGAQVAGCQTVPEFEKVAFSLKTGEVGKPVKSQYGWHVIEALAIAKPRQVIPYDEVKAGIRQQLTQQHKNESVTAWTNKIQSYYSTRVKYGKDYEPPAPATTETTTSIVPTSPVPSG